MGIVSRLSLLFCIGLLASCSALKSTFLTQFSSKDPCADDSCLANKADEAELYIQPDLSVVNLLRGKTTTATTNPVTSCAAAVDPTVVDTKGVVQSTASCGCECTCNGNPMSDPNAACAVAPNLKICGKACKEGQTMFELSGKCSASYYREHVITVSVYAGTTAASPVIAQNDLNIIPVHNPEMLEDSNSNYYVQCSRGHFSVMIPLNTACAWAANNATTCSTYVSFGLEATDEKGATYTAPTSGTLINQQ